MKIERLELFGYTRLMLANIQRFVYTPLVPCQIILGTNGCGKSSVLYELSPLPAQSGQYTKEGFKKIWISHKGVQYVLESTFKHGNKHSFIRDGEELNPGGTGMVQKDLVAREFNYTQDMHLLLIGETRLTQMAPMKRREWITKLDSVDYVYPLSVYNQFRTRARDHQGTLKHLRQRLIAETNNLQMLSDTDGMEDRAHLLHHELNALLTQRLPNLPTRQQTQGRVEQLLARISTVSDSVVGLVSPMPEGKRYSGLQDATDDLQSLESDLNVTQTLLTRSTTEYTELEAVMQEFTSEGELSLENVDQFVAECNAEENKLTGQIDIFHGLQEPELIRRDNEQILDLVMGLFVQLPENADRRYSREANELANARIREQQVIINKGSQALEKIGNRLRTIAAAKNSECPSCGYVWLEGVSEEEVAQNEQWQVEHEAIIEAAEKAIERERRFLEESDGFGAMYTQFRGYVNNYPRMRPLWDHILQNNLLLSNPAGQTGLFLTWRRDVELNAQLTAVQHKRAHALELVERQKKMGSAAHFSNRMAILMEEIDNLTGAIGVVRTKAKSVRQFRDRMLRMSEAVTQLESATQELERARDVLIDATRNDLIDQAVHSHQIELAGIQHRLTEKRTLEGVVNDLNKDHDNVAVEHAVYTLLSKALSPDEGLIAEQLRGFIGCLVDQMNSVISAVWSYDLQIMPCGMDSGDLDYKFPMNVVNIVRDDISEGSKGIQAIVDFAFQLTAMLYMGLDDYPLYLDEPGEGLDEQHRTNLMSFIKQLIDSGRYSQLFMISHFATSHGAFLNSEILVLDGNNIAVPSGHNTHVVLG